MIVNKIENLTMEQRKLLFHLTTIMNHSKLKDLSNPPTLKESIERYGSRNISEIYKPEAFDFRNPETMYFEYWNQYIFAVASHGTLKSEKEQNIEILLSKGVNF
ncbi:MAG: hypothetical protein JWP66_2079 [Naasia sp.]|nr:hypothetical protein [Naasia sp.]